ncbi:DNA alkylation repair protein [Candidatus Entotheonella serta]|nr:DNA alkylation repair protein [Candidatus Entotheonella serta]
MSERKPFKDWLEFAGRVQQFSDALAATLPQSVPKALAVLIESLPPPLPDCEAVTDGWLQWPVGQFIADHGLDHVEASMKAMIELTQRFTSEYAVRPFVERYPEVTFARLLALTDHPSPHVRRWCSEGARPRLPWGKKLQRLVADPSPIWPILESLKDDDELYVRRSVANNLNDIAKDHAALVVQRCGAWSEDGNERRDWVIKHGLRSLIKAGDAGALAVIGFGPPQGVTAILSIQPEQIAIGGEIALSAQLETTSRQAQALIVDYAVHYVRQGGKTSDKVFKWTTLQLPARERVTLDKRHSMKATTVRALYPGVHQADLQINGVRVAEGHFRLI